MKPYLSSYNSHYTSNMPGGHFGGHLGGHLGGHTTFLHHMPLTKRKRTVSADSGCDMTATDPNSSLSNSPPTLQAIDTNPAIMEETVRIWANRMETVLQQQVTKARQMSDEHKKALYIADVPEQERLMRAWQVRLLSIMDFTADLIQCVNNDIKESLTDNQVYNSREEFPLLKEENELQEDDETYFTTDNYVKNFDYYDEDSFDSISLSNSEGDGQPFKPLATSDQPIETCEPKVSKSARRRIRRKLGFSRGYFTKAAPWKSRSIVRWLNKCNKAQSKEKRELRKSGETDVSTEDSYEMARPGKCPFLKSLAAGETVTFERTPHRKRSIHKAINKQKIKHKMTTKLHRMKIIRRMRELAARASMKKMLNSVLDQEDLFEDWRWNLKEFEAVEDIFSEWKWNLIEFEDIEDIFRHWRWNLEEYEEVENIFNDWLWNLSEENWENWKFWNSIGTAKDILYNTEAVLTEPPPSDLPFLAQNENNTWTDWKFWKSMGPVQSILYNTEAVELASCDEAEINNNDTNQMDNNWEHWPFWNKMGTTREILRNTEAVLQETHEAEIPNAPNEPKDWTEWKFWNKFGPVKSILYNTETVDLASCDEAELVQDDQEESNEDGDYAEIMEDDWTAWTFWNEFGSKREILENMTDMMVFGGFEEFVWFGNDDFLKDIGYVGGVIIGEADSGCIGSEDEYLSLLPGGSIETGTTTTLTNTNSTTKLSSLNTSTEDSLNTSCGSIKTRRRKEKRARQAERMLQRRYGYGSAGMSRVCKALATGDNLTVQVKRKPDGEADAELNHSPEKRRITEDFMDKHLIFKSLIPRSNDPDNLGGDELVFWEDSDREVDDPCPKPASKLSNGNYTIDEIVFWEDSSRDEEEDLIRWEDARSTSSPDVGKLFNTNNVEFMDDPKWRIFKPVMGQLWVDIEDNSYDEFSEDSIEYSGQLPPALQIAAKRKRWAKNRRPSRSLQFKRSPAKALKTKASIPLDVNDQLWDIEANGKEESLNSVLANLPFFESPDVFFDACDLMESSEPPLENTASTYRPRKKPRDPANIFRGWRHIFEAGGTSTDSMRRRGRGGRRRRRCQERQLGGNQQEEDVDIFKDWAVWALEDECLEVRGRRLGRQIERLRVLKVKAKNKRADSPTILVKTVSNSRSPAQTSSWILDTSQRVRQSTAIAKDRRLARIQERSKANLRRCLSPNKQRGCSRNFQIFQPTSRRANLAGRQ